MHIQINDQQTGETNIMCVNRDTQSAILLHVTTEEGLNTLLSIAGELRVGRVMMVASAESVDKLRSLGWNIRTELVVAEKIAGRKGDARAEVTVCDVR